MSGLNPFRPRKPENPQDHHPPPPSVTTNDAAPEHPIAVDTVATAAITRNGIVPTPSVSYPTDADDSTSEDDPSSTSDPFRQEPLSDEEEEEEKEERPYPPVPPRGKATRTDVYGSPEERHRDRIPRTAASSDKSARRSVFLSDPTSLEGSPHAVMAGNENYRSGKSPSSVDEGRRPLASRPGNKDKIPPPPPKSHHGRLISPSSGNSSTTSASRPASIMSSNRFSFHGFPSEPSVSPSLRSREGDDVAEGQPRPDLPRRSQSQYKRPPTPPLSRRHSQMKRSQPAASVKTTPHRRSVSSTEPSSSDTSPPLSPGAGTLDNSRTRDVAQRTRTSEDASRPLQPEPRDPSTSAKRVSYGNSLPPPPPPRRTRGNSSNPSTRPTSLRSETRAEDEEGFVSPPSNARDILADLTRLQREVDDLRGHYERKASH
ncbi:hypothetical protein P168DRAFT_322974 [Aspergillus campestris IBT 28561]|uniref:Uncharacterized protein n=1 Tax=Aspergillus campestris (strain IBT 28561) TaxID=1392248 RepID=A0A2I1DCY4_ASPC2|nr:uncharacterized protein P168DRAFT_322974 [Aspergillus campestris IBT 28561]PKY07739.1 hypothetical protein P168DRAFT_322974 [Aspergillus campestris IBT 28561]